MTIKEKAHNLFNSFGVIIAEKIDVDGFVCNTEQAKKCALIAVDEVIEAIKNQPYGLHYLSQAEYWEEVKQEIELL